MTELLRANLRQKTLLEEVKYLGIHLFYSNLKLSREVFLFSF